MTKKKLPKKDKKLDFKRLRFAEEYIVDWNGKQAAIRAGYSPRTAESQASRLLTNVKVREYIEECKNKIEELAGVSKLRAIKKLAQIAFADITEAYNEDGSLKPISEIPEDVRACIEGLETSQKETTFDIGLVEKDGEEDIEFKPSKETIVKIKFTPNRAAIQDLSKMLGWNDAQKIEHSGEIKNSLASLSTSELVERARATKEISKADKKETE